MSLFKYVIVLSMMWSVLLEAHTNDIDLQDLNRKAIQSAEKSLEAHGGRAGAENFRVSLVISSEFQNENQSVAAVAPFESYPQRIEMKVDQPGSRFSVSFDSRISGDFRFIDHSVFENGKGYSMDPVVKTYEETTTEPFWLDYFFPHRRLLQALANSASLRFVGNTGQRETIEVVSYATSTGQIQTLHLDRNTHLVRKWEQVASLGVYGDGRRELEFAQYRKVGAMLLPTRVVARNYNSVHGVVENTYRYEDISTEVTFAEAEFQVPAGYAKADYSYRDSFALKELSRGAYLLENVTETKGQWSYNVFFVVFDSFVLVAEAPVSSSVSERVLQKIKEVAPGKPVRYLVQSHHHGDHIAGIRPYIADGTTILTGPQVVPLIEKIAIASFSIHPDRLQQEPRAPVVEGVESRKVITDGSQEVVVYNIGPNPHARDMMVVYLPGPKILYQSDMINEGEYPENESTRDFYEKIKKLGLEVSMIAGLHGKIRQMY